MAFEEIKKKGVVEVGMEGEVGLVAGRSQREKRRSYKDLLREEEEIAAQVRKSSKKRPKDSEPFLLGGDSHKKKKKHSEDYYYRDQQGSGPPPHKKKRKSSDHSPSLSSSSSSHPTDTAMGLLQAITSPMATGSDPSPHLHKKPSYPSFSSSHFSKDRKRDGSTGGSKGSHSSHSRPMSSSSSSKKHSSKSSSLFHGGTGTPKGDLLNIREPDGLRMKLMVSPKEKAEGEGFPFPPHSSSSSKGGIKKEKDRDRKQLSKVPKKMQQSRDPLPVKWRWRKLICIQLLLGGRTGGRRAGDRRLVQASVKEKEEEQEKQEEKGEREGQGERQRREREEAQQRIRRGPIERPHPYPWLSQSFCSWWNVCHGGPHPYSHPYSPSSNNDGEEEKEGGEGKGKHEKEKDKPKKKNTTAYQVFCKEYRVNINAEQPGLVFGELSKRLAEVWKQLPEKDKLVWKQKAQYLQHKQNKAEATTVKRKSSTDGVKSKGSMKGMGLAAGLVSPNRASVGVSLSPARVPDVDPIDAAAHLQLLGESLSLIGHRLQETEGMVAVSGSLSVLLDSILCALGPLTCLTAQIPQLNGCPRQVLSNTLDNIAYIMPGL
ncbi:unnamed protein product [Oncorhynchus mykiss]|uniref:HMG box domain-containing protein n=1 Tax=Oncorhynchus mykiss TaxID=8022 RepID=A0A060WTU4_ONCMY|nr:unnamed protein product [Oncorhynchus mykiss]